jgi:hypothetical protein
LEIDMSDGTPMPETACARPTRKYPDGRTGTRAGYDAHKAAGETACRPCVDAFSAKLAEWKRALSPDKQAERQRQAAESARRWRDRQRAAGQANAAEGRYRDRLRALGMENVARDRFIASSREIIRAAKDKPCSDCGIAYPYYVMQFDHLDAASKEFNIGVMGPTVGRDRLLDEIAKCEVVCANCHAERTHQRHTESARQRQRAREAS